MLKPSSLTSQDDCSGLYRSTRRCCSRQIRQRIRGGYRIRGCRKNSRQHYWCRNRYRSGCLRQSFHNAVPTRTGHVVLRRLVICHMHTRHVMHCRRCFRCIGKLHHAYITESGMGEDSRQEEDASFHVRISILLRHKNISMIQRKGNAAVYSAHEHVQARRGNNRAGIPRHGAS